jgi:hypothetical protein
MKIEHTVKSGFAGKTEARLSSPVTAEFILSRCDATMLAELDSRRDEMSRRPDLIAALDRALAATRL